MRLKSTKHRWRFKTEYLEDRVEQTARFLTIYDLQESDDGFKPKARDHSFEIFQYVLYTAYWKVAFYCVISWIFVTCSLISYAIFLPRAHFHCNYRPL